MPGRRTAILLLFASPESTRRPSGACGRPASAWTTSTGRTARTPRCSASGSRPARMSLRTVLGEQPIAWAACAVVTYIAYSRFCERTMYSAILRDRWRCSQRYRRILSAERSAAGQPTGRAVRISRSRCADRAIRAGHFPWVPGSSNRGAVSVAPADVRRSVTRFVTAVASAASSATSRCSAAAVSAGRMRRAAPGTRTVPVARWRYRPWRRSARRSAGGSRSRVRAEPVRRRERRFRIAGARAGTLAVPVCLRLARAAAVPALAPAALRVTAGQQAAAGRATGGRVQVWSGVS